MADNDYFDESVPDGISNAMMEVFPDLECRGQDGYELLVKTFGSAVNGKRVKAFSDDDCERMALAIQSLFGLSSRPSRDQARRILSRALEQWGG
jgi:hypothetical protein